MALRLASSPSARRAASRSDVRAGGGGDEGFSLVEVLGATLILVFGLVALAYLLMATLQMHALAANSAEATRLAQGKFDELLRMDYASAPAVQVTPTGVDPLAGDVANYFDAPAPGVTRRWRVQAGPASTETRVVTIRVLVRPQTVTGRQLELTSLLRQW
jgi:Tfp pilus assembly protein PilV